MGKLEVQENSGVSVSLPHNDGVNATNYKGQAKPASTKDCILIIDHETGELTLERLSNQVKDIDRPKYVPNNTPNFFLDPVKKDSTRKSRKVSG